VAERREGGPRRIGDLIQGMSTRADLRFGARRVDAVDALREALDEVLGESVAARCRAGSIIGTEARVECRDSATALRVRFQVPDILQTVRTRLVAADVTAIRVTVATHGWCDG
jgi:hypothetical protein